MPTGATGATGPTGATGATGETFVAAYTKITYTATASQTTFNANYTVNYVDVYYNGVKLTSSEFSATNGTTVVLTTPATENAIVEIIAWNVGSLGLTGPAFVAAYTKTNYTATSGQTTFSATYVVGYVDVYYNGSKLADSDFTATDGFTVVLNTPATTGANIELVSWNVSTLGITGPTGVPGNLWSQTGTTIYYNDGNVGIGTSGASARLDVVDGLTGGQVLISDNKTNATEKYGTLGVTHYTNSEEPALAIGIQSNATDNNVLIGGALGEFNAATSIRFYTAANHATPAGSERMRISSDGAVGIGATPQTQTSVRVARDIGGNAFSVGVSSAGTVQTSASSRADYFLAVHSTAGSVPNVIGFRVQQSTITGTLTSQTGFLAAASLIGATNNYGFVSEIPSGANRWNFYSSGTADNYFEGNVGIGITIPSNKVHIVNDSSATNTVTDVLRVESRSSGTPAAGIGVGIEFAAETSANNYEIGAVIEAVTTDVTSTSEDFDLVFRTMAGGAAASESARITSTGIVQDSKGDVRTLVVNSQGTGYTLVASDHGKLIDITTGGVTVPSGVFTAGQNITIYNDSASGQTITQGASVTLRLAGTATTGNRTLAQRGICTVVCVASNEFVISGTGLT